MDGAVEFADLLERGEFGGYEFGSPVRCADVTDEWVEVQPARWVNGPLACAPAGSLDGRGWSWSPQRGPGSVLASVSGAVVLTDDPPGGWRRVHIYRTDRREGGCGWRGWEFELYTWTDEVFYVSLTTRAWRRWEDAFCYASRFVNYMKGQVCDG